MAWAWISASSPTVPVAEAGNSFGLLADFAKRFGLSVHRVRLAPGSGVSLARQADAGARGEAHPVDREAKPLGEVGQQAEAVARFRDPAP